MNAYKSISLFARLEWDEAEKLRSDPFFYAEKKYFLSIQLIDSFLIHRQFIILFNSFTSFFSSVLFDSTTACNDVYKNQIMTAFSAKDKLFLFFIEKKNIFLVHHFLVVTACGISSSHAISIIFLYLLTTTKIKYWIIIFSNLLCLGIIKDNFFLFLFHFTLFCYFLMINNWQIFTLINKLWL